MSHWFGKPDARAKLSENTLSRLVKTQTLLFHNTFFLQKHYSRFAAPLFGRSKYLYETGTVPPDAREKVKVKKKSYKSSYYSAILKKTHKTITCMEQGQFPPKQLNHGFDHHWK